MCSDCRCDIHHAPTVEDVLREFAERMNENLGMYTGEAIDADEWRDADAKTVAEYAAKLRLAEEVDVCYTLASPPRGLGFDPREH